MDMPVTNLQVNDEKTILTYEFAGRTWRLNYDGAAKYHALNSSAKLHRLAAAVPGNAKMVIDVGANCGLFSGMTAARCPGAVVHAFEPSQSLLPLIALNAPAAHVHGELVGEINGAADLFINRFSQQTNSTLASAILPFSTPDQVRRVTLPQITLDTFCARERIDAIDVLKIDVQGAEGAVLRGAKSILPSVSVLLIESSWLELDSIAAVLPFARHYGFAHLGVLNPVHLGADLLLTRHEALMPQDLLARFRTDEPIRDWF
jgi:FkbM family methyltransferase